MKEVTNEQVTQVFLETITPEYPEAERTEDSVNEYQEMLFSSYIKSLPRAQRRKLLNKQYKFSNEVKKALNKKK